MTWVACQLCGSSRYAANAIKCDLVFILISLSFRCYRCLNPVVVELRASNVISNGIILKLQVRYSNFSPGSLICIVSLNLITLISWFRTFSSTCKGESFNVHHLPLSIFHFQMPKRRTSLYHWPDLLPFFEKFILLKFECGLANWFSRVGSANVYVYIHY